MKDKIIILFSVVAAFLFIITLFLIYANGQQKAINVPTPHPTPFLTTCQLNDKNYAVGESFKSADGCNTCSCTADFQIACTEMACITSTPAPSIKATPTKTATVSAIPQGWKNYQLPDEKLSFSYPQNWKLKTESTGSIGTRYSVTSPNNFNLIFITSLDGLGGGCDEVCQSQNIKNTVLGTLNFSTKPLYIVVNGFKDKTNPLKAEISFNVIPTKTCWSNLCYGFNGKNTPSVTIIEGAFPGKLMTPVEFTNSADVKTAVSILKTLTY